MKNFLIISALAAVLIVGLAIFASRSKPQTADLPNTATPSPAPVSGNTDISATFTIITGNITRSFKADKYHNQSPDVYIEASDPKVIHVKKAGITWDDFFQTLPMKLTKDCLVTGDGETLCDGKSGSLKFYLNEIETPNLLDKEIKEDDKALIKFIFF